MKHDYARLVTAAAWLATFVASVLLIIKVIAWWMTGSVSLLASLIDSMIDIAASVVNLIVLKYALQPADKEHKFGHGKAESLAALAQAMFISGSAIFLILNGVQRFFHPQALVSPQWGVYVSIIAIIATSGLVQFQKYVVKKTGSQAIAADSLHYQTDLYMNIAIAFALGLSWFGMQQADAIFAIVIGIYISYCAIKMANTAIQTLLDRSLPEEDNHRIIEIVLSVEGVLGMHQLRTRMSGPIRFIQLHIELQDEMPLLEAHELSDMVESKLRAAFPDSDILIHQDPLSVVLNAQGEVKPQDWYGTSAIRSE
ncbi:CDF family cation-efflux transporter FieF [Vibrio palustris]|uniref:Cation-efflux pump FieF n=1 Tax=Vibrio palustris TaxID=1918946 RepID=A0A1R4B763_9VIBR|nr:CDF family cation-efflux transporter FieF [Vibrio palustris]SJL84755.1 Ferrous-iron efflux pump FieF [Vibrio palustris]